MVEDTKACARCGAVKPVTSFGLNDCGNRRNACHDCRRGKPKRPAACHECGAAFVPKAYENSRYCSQSCANRASRSVVAERAAIGRFSVVPWRNCLECGQEFYRRGGAKLCSPKCRRVWAVRKSGSRPSGTLVTAVCVECGRDFQFTLRTNTLRLCSAECRKARAEAQHRRANARREARLSEQPSELVRPIDIYLRDGWRCQICGGQVDKRAKMPHPKSPTLDHIVPVSLGGPHTRQNLRLAHFLCNSKRGNRESGQMLLIG